MNIFNWFKTPIPKVGAVYAGPETEFISDRRDYWRVAEISKNRQKVKVEEVCYYGPKGKVSPASSPNSRQVWPVFFLRNFTLLPEDGWDEFDTP